MKSASSRRRRSSARTSPRRHGAHGRGAPPGARPGLAGETGLPSPTIRFTCVARPGPGARGDGQARRRSSSTIEPRARPEALPRVVSHGGLRFAPPARVIHDPPPFFHWARAPARLTFFALAAIAIARRGTTASAPRRGAALALGARRNPLQQARSRRPRCSGASDLPPPGPPPPGEPGSFKAKLLRVRGRRAARAAPRDRAAAPGRHVARAPALRDRGRARGGALVRPQPLHEEARARWPGPRGGGVQSGMLVIDADGVAGQVTAVGTSRARRPAHGEGPVRLR